MLSSENISSDEFSFNLKRPGRREVSFDLQWPTPTPTATNVPRGVVTLDVNQHSSPESILHHLPHDVIDLSGPSPSKGTHENVIDLSRSSPPPVKHLEPQSQGPAVTQQFNPKSPDGDHSRGATPVGTFNFQLKRPDGASTVGVAPVNAAPIGAATDGTFNFDLKRPVGDIPDGTFNFTLKRPSAAPPDSSVEHTDEPATEGPFNFKLRRPVVESVPSNAVPVQHKQPDGAFNFTLKRPAAAPHPITEEHLPTVPAPISLNTLEEQAFDPMAKAHIPGATSRISTHPSLSNEYTAYEWLTEKLSFPRYEVS